MKQGGRFFEAKEEIRESAAILYSLARSSRRMSLKARDALFKGFPVWGAPPSKDGTVKLPHGITFYSNGVAVEILGKNSEEVFFRTVNEADQKAIDELFGPESENSLKRNQAARHLTTKFYDLLNESNQINLKVERLTVKIENLFNEAKLEPSIANYVQKGITHDEKGQPTLATQFFDTIDELNLLVRQELYPQLRTQAGDVK